MKKTLLLLFFVSFYNSNAQAVEWKTDISQAIEVSNKTRKPLLILFTGNNLDKELQAQVFDTYDFAEWSKKNVVLVRLDLSSALLDDPSKEANVKLKNAFGINEIPTICFAKATIRNYKTTFQFIGKFSYDKKGLRSWMSQAENTLNHEE